MTPTLRFQDLNPVGRAIILTVAVLTAGVAAVAFLTSYGALYAFVRDNGEYSERLTRIYPLMLDAAFVTAELGAILFRILRGSLFWPVVTMLLTGALTIWFNVQHAGHGWDRRLIAALPPVMMMLAFQVDVAVVRSVMRALGRTEQAFGGQGFGGYGAGTFPPAGAFGQMPSQAYARNGHHGQPEWGSGAGTKREIVEAYLARTGNANLTPREIAADLAEEGTPVSQRYVADLLERGRGSRNGKGHP